VDDVASELGDKIQREFGAGLERQVGRVADSC
jgi:hypothetical protein